MRSSETSDPPVGPADTTDPYRNVVYVLLAMASLATAAAIVGASALANPVLSDVAMALGVSAGVIIGVGKAQALRARPPKDPISATRTDAEASAQRLSTEEPQNPPDIPAGREGIVASRPNALVAWLRDWLRDLGELGTIQVATAATGSPA